MHYFQANGNWSCITRLVTQKVMHYFCNRLLSSSAQCAHMMC